jgi:hydroxymethylpyrimidine/phosphomethylpyrimidine kinase
MPSETYSRAKIPRTLTIAGSDSSAGAGIQADLKTFAALGVYGLSVVTAITAQNTLGVRATEDVAPTLVEAQMEAVLEDIGADVAKTGMLSNAPIVEVVVRQVRKWGLRLVVDPVMLATSGHPLLSSEAVAILCSQLLPLAEVVTPNLPEAEVLTGRRVETLDDMRAAASALFDLGARHVVVKGGHRGQAQGAAPTGVSFDRERVQGGQAQGAAPTDIYFDGEHFVELRAERIQTVHTHGTGCTFSAAIAALLARGMSVEEAVVGAKHYITGAIRHAPGLGHGHGPVGHFWQWEQQRNGESNS